MTKGELITRLKDRTGLPKQQLALIMDALLSELAEAFIRQERVEIRGFGVFIPVHRKRKKSDEKLPRIKFKLSNVIREKMVEEERRRSI